MNTEPLELLVSGEAMVGARHLSLAPHHLVGEIKQHITAFDSETEAGKPLVFEENREEPLEDALPLEQLKVTRLHVHRCRSVKVRVRDGAHEVEACFAPGTTLEHIYHTLVDRQGRCRLRISGTHHMPPGSTHVGCYVYYPFGELVLETA